MVKKKARKASVKTEADMAPPRSLAPAPLCTPANATAQKLLASCATSYAGSNIDCNVFVKAACGDFVTDGFFDGLDADGIVNKLESTAGWKKTLKIGEAIAAAKIGKVVIAGMTSSDLGDAHGHLAVVVGCDGQTSGTVTVPVGYAGSLKPSARLNGGRLTGTFNAQTVREEKLPYYTRAAERIPAAPPFAMLLGALQLANSAATSIAWGKKVSPEFKSTVIAVAENLGIQVDFLMACIAFESAGTFSPSITNPSSHAVGLIQFMPATATRLGTTTGQLGQMTATEQLAYVEKYFAPWSGKLPTLGDLYMAILWPKAVSQPDTYVLFEEGSVQYDQNKALDTDGDGKVTRANAVASVQKRLAEGREKWAG